MENGVQTFKRFLPDILILGGFSVFLYKIFRTEAAIQFPGQFPVIYNIEWVKILGVMAIAVGVDVVVHRYLLKK